MDLRETIANVIFLVVSSILAGLALYSEELKKTPWVRGAFVTAMVGLTIYAGISLLVVRSDSVAATSREVALQATVGALEARLAVTPTLAPTAPPATPEPTIPVPTPAPRDERLRESTLAFFDFENGDLTGWSVNEQDTPNASIGAGAEAVVGSGSLVVTAEANPGSLRDFLVLQTAPRSFKADTVVARVYWPERSGVEVTYAVLCADSVDNGFLCAALPQSPGRWHTFTLNLREFIEWREGEEERQQPQFIRDHSALDLKGLVIMGKYRSLDPNDTPEVSFFVDAVEIWSER